jgi:hypothetical protein
MGTEPQSNRRSAFYFARLARQQLAAADSLFGAESKPGSESRSIAESAYIRPDLSKNHLRGQSANAWNVCKVNSCDAVQLTAKIKRWIIDLTLVLCAFCSFRNLLLHSR